MQEYSTIIGKLLSGIERKKFKRIVDKYKGDFAVKKLSCWEQFVAVFLGQITGASTLREIVDLIKFHSNQQYHLGIKKDIARSTLAKANETRDWQIYRDIFFDLVSKFQETEYYQTTQIVKIIDSTPTYLKIMQHPWIETTMRIKGLKTHVVYDLTNNTPVYFDITGAKTNDITKAKEIEIEKGVMYVFDKGYMDYKWWNDIAETEAYFVTRLKVNSAIIELDEVQKHSEKISSQLIKIKPSHHGKNRSCTQILKRVIVERENDTPLVLVTNDINRSSEEIANLYKSRWQIELFFKWIKQNLKIKKFLGRSENAIKTQICIAMICFVLLRMAEELKTVCSEISIKNLLKIIGNSLFNCLRIRKYGRKYYKNPNQLQFAWTFT